jgi:hypothetical protein
MILPAPGRDPDLQRAEFLAGAVERIAEASVE